MQDDLILPGVEVANTPVAKQIARVDSGLSQIKTLNGGAVFRFRNFPRKKERKKEINK
jgi:hypothetical protein